MAKKDGFGGLYALWPEEVSTMGIEKKSLSGAKGRKRTAASKARGGAKLTAPAGRKLTNMKGVEVSPIRITKPIDVSNP